MTQALATDELISLASPARGRSIAGAVARAIDDVHFAVAALSDRVQTAGNSPAWPTKVPGDTIEFADRAERAGWALTAIALIEALSTSATPSVSRALNWFEGHTRENSFDDSRVDEALTRVVAHPDAAAMLPYYLDTFGKTSRLDVLRNSERSGSRRARKEVGSFYTPADLAFFMVDAVAGERGVSGATPFEAAWYDPACGSGVFLNAALRLAIDRGVTDPVSYAAERLFGTDIAPQACDFSAFVLVHALAPYLTGAPVDVWSSLRSHIVARDALPLALDRRGGRAALGALFPLGNAPLRLICNPPYAVAGAGARIDDTATRSLYLPFVEMSWRFAGGSQDASAVVVPLALATNTGADHRRCRTAMSRSGGDWTLLFFDRQPHALFGEDAKTRAAVAIRRPHTAPANIRTSGLLKWTSRQRRQIFSEALAVPIGSASIGRLIPKLGSTAEAKLYAQLVEYRLHRIDRPEIEKAAPDEIVGTALSNDVFVGGTAYNFLNVFRNYPDNLSWRGELSTSGIHKLRFADAEAAAVASALLGSRVSFWLWHVECDGFHVPTWFIADLPLLDLAFSDAERAALASLGARIWDGLQHDILVSNNRGRLTFAFRPSQVGELRRDVDAIIFAHLGVDQRSAKSIDEFEFRVVSIDGSSRTARSTPSASIQSR